MKLGYIIQKILKKMFNRPCVNQSNIEKSARIDIGSVVVETSMDRYSYIGEHTSVLCAEIGAFTCISNYCAIGGGSHPIDWVSVSPVFNTTKGIIKKKLSSLQYSPFQKIHIGNDVWIGSHIFDFDDNGTQQQKICSKNSRMCCTTRFNMYLYFV